MNLLPEVYVKVIAITQAQFVNTSEVWVLNAVRSSTQDWWKVI